MTEHELNVAYESMLDKAWDEYNEEKPQEDDYDDHDYDVWAEEMCK